MGAIFGRHRRSRVTEEDKALLQLKQQRDQLKQYKQRVNTAITRDDAAIRQLLRQQERKKALLLLKKKKYQEKLLVKADEHLTTVEGLIQDVEFAQVQVKVLDSLKKGNEALKQLNALMKLEDVEKIMSDAQEAQAYQEELTNLLAGGLSTSDDAEVESELEQLLAVDTDKLPEVPRTEVPKPEPAEHRAKRAENQVTAECMDRFRWCTDDIHALNSSSSRGAAESLVLQQSGVRVYNGPGRTSFDNGTLKLTTHRLIWSDHAGGSKIHLPLAAVASTQLQTSSGLTGSGTPKIVVKLLSPSALETAFKSLSGPPVWAGDWIVDKAEKRVAISSGIDFVRFGFTKMGHIQFEQALRETLQAKCWLVSNLPTTVSGRTRGTGGILAIERAMAVKASSADRSISEAFEDLSRLISRAGEMVALSRSLAEKHRSKKEAGTDVGEDETAELRRAMLSMGLSDTSGAEISPMAGSAFEASSFHGQLAVQICKVLHPILTARTHGDRAHECSGCIDLASAYCRINRARGVELISPEDLLYAARMMKHLQLPLRLKRFDSGVMVIELASESDESTTQSTLQCVESHQCLSAGALARLAGIAPILARERLLQAEERGLLCRDDSDGGLVFFPNLFETRAA